MNVYGHWNASRNISPGSTSMAASRKWMSGQVHLNDPGIRREGVGATTAAGGNFISWHRRSFLLHP